MVMKFLPTDQFKTIWQRLRYPKFMLLVFTFMVAYVLLTGSNFDAFRDYILSLGLWGAFVAGIFYSYGFTAAPATAAFLLIAREQNIWVAGIIGGLGSLVADLVIFKFIRTSFDDEIEKISNERITQYVHGHMPLWMKRYLVPLIGCIVIASPLPDEIGVTLLALSTISTRLFMLMSYLLNTFGILIILYIGTLA
jgi:uncharacterized membrane protein YdjX (TVP38/TMEM64 family)